MDKVYSFKLSRAITIGAPRDDPSLTNAGIVGPMKENEWWVEWLVRKL